MLASLRRLYFYVIAASALIFITVVLQNFLYQWAVQLGIRDHPYSVVNPQAYSQSLAFLVVALIIVLPVGGLHWWFIRRDAREDPAALGGVVRELFLDVFTILMGTVAMIATVWLAFVYFATTPSYGFFAPGTASLLSVALAWGLALGALVLERRATPDLTGAPRGISMVLGYLTQLCILLGLISLGAQMVQEIFDHYLIAYPSCATLTQFGNGPCQYERTSVNGAIIGTLIELAGLAGFMVWTQRDTSTIYRRLADAAFVLTATIATLMGLYQLFLLLLNFILSKSVALPAAIVDTSDYTVPHFALGSLVPGALALGFFLLRASATHATEGHARQAFQVALVAAAVPLAANFLSGVTAILYDLVQHLRGYFFNPLPAWSLLLTGLAWVGLWPVLARMSDPRGAGPAAPRRAYVIILLGGTVLGSVIGLAVGLYDVITNVIGVAVDTTGEGTTNSLITALVLGVAAGYFFFVLQRDQKTLREQAVPTTQPAASAASETTGTPTPAPTLESVLQQLADGQLTVAQTLSILREQFGAP